jgi:hypothetical protein
MSHYIIKIPPPPPSLVNDYWKRKLKVWKRGGIKNRVEGVGRDGQIGQKGSEVGGLNKILVLCIKCRVYLDYYTALVVVALIATLLGLFGVMGSG